MAGRVHQDPTDPGLKAWSAQTAYLAGDVVTSSGALYGAIVGNTNVTPTAGATWDKLLDTNDAADVDLTGLGFAPTLAAALPSATLNTNGAAVATAFAAGYGTLLRVDAITLTYASVGSETVTSTITATYDDASTVTITDTKTASGANSVSAANLLTLVKDGHRITGLSVQVKSSINSSTATVTMLPTGWQSL